MATREDILRDIERVRAKQNDPNTQAYFQKNYGGLDKYLSDQMSRLSQVQVTPTTQTAPAQQTQYNDQIGKTLTDIQKRINTPFSYNYKSDPQYKAAQAASDANAKRTGDLAMESLNARGLLKSTITGDRVADIYKDESDRLAAMLPGLEQNAYTQYQGNISNMQNLANMLMSLQEADWQKDYQERQFGYAQQQDSQAAQRQAEMDALTRAQWEASPEAQEWYLPTIQKNMELENALTQYQLNKPYYAPSSGGSSTAKPTQTDRYNSSRADAMAAVSEAVSSGLSLEQIEAEINRQAPELVRQGVDPAEIIDYLYSLPAQTAASPTSPSSNPVNPLKQRPWWQKAIDTVVPGGQYR